LVGHPLFFIKPPPALPVEFQEKIYFEYWFTNRFGSPVV
jgi:hypothetical protein